jgi:hypothetical protein
MPIQQEPFESPLVMPMERWATLVQKPRKLDRIPILQGDMAGSNRRNVGGDTREPLLFVRRYERLISRSTGTTEPNGLDAQQRQQGGGDREHRGGEQRDVGVLRRPSQSPLPPG